jgi:hypothetical protein
MEALILIVVFGTPNGCHCHPDLYRCRYTWALYTEEGKFHCSGQPFHTWLEAFEAGTEFLKELPSQENPFDVDQN